MAPFGKWPSFYDWVHTNITEDIPFYVEEALRSGGPVLELGCGTGRVSIPIVQASIAIVGVDLSQEMVEEARENAKKAGLDPKLCTFLVQDMRELSLEGHFPLAIMPYRSFQWLLSVADQRAALECVHHYLSPSARLVMDLFVPHLEMLVEDDSEPFAVKDVPDPATGRRLRLLFQNRWDHLHQINNALLIAQEVDGAEEVVKEVSRDIQVRYTFRYELQHLLEVCGFRVLEVYGGFQRQELTEESENMVWVAERVG